MSLNDGAILHFQEVHVGATSVLDHRKNIHIGDGRVHDGVFCLVLPNGLQAQFETLRIFKSECVSSRLHLPLQQTHDFG